MKHNLTKRILSFVLAFAMMFCMLPATALPAFAEEISKSEIEMEEIQNSEPIVEMAAVNDDIATVAETDCNVTDNVIDITDRQIYKRSNSIYINAINVTVTGATVKSATEDGMIG